MQPLAQQPGRALVALAMIVLLSAASALAASDVGWGVIAAIVLGIALNRVILPSRYQIEPGALVVDHPLRRRRVAWSQLERVAFDDAGALLRGPGLNLSIDLPRDAALQSRVISAMRAGVPESCVVSDRRPAPAARMAPTAPEGAGANGEAA